MSVEMKLNSIILLAVGLILISSCNRFIPQKYPDKASIKIKDYFYEFNFTDKKPKPKDNSVYFYFANQNLKQTLGSYTGKLLDGPFKKFYFDTNNLAESGEFSVGIKEGKWMFYDENGYFLKQEIWKNGELKEETFLEMEEEIEMDSDTIENKRSIFQRLFKRAQKDSIPAE